MRVRLRLFAMLRERADWKEQEFRLEEGATVSDAWQAACDAVPALRDFGEVVRFARNGRYAGTDDALADGDELAIIPPVAGGSGDALAARLRRCEMSDQPIADELLAALRQSLPTTADGALAIFVGQVRDTPGPPSPGQQETAAEHAGEPVTGLHYEAYDEMALAVLNEIADEIEQRFGVRRLAIVHRTGHVALGQPSVVIAAAAAHRAAAFDACRYAIEELKARAPIWKRELYADGSVWVGAPARHAAEQEPGDG